MELGLCRPPIACLVLLHKASHLAVTHHHLPGSAGGDAGESETLLRGDVGMLSADGACASLAEDEGLLDLPPEAYESIVFHQQALTLVGLGRLWNMV